MSKRYGARNKKEEQRRELEAAGWELVERGGGKTIWRNPQSGRLYPQSVAITLVREGPSPRIVDEAPGTGRELGSQGLRGIRSHGEPPPDPRSRTGRAVYARRELTP